MVTAASLAASFAIDCQCRGVTAADLDRRCPPQQASRRLERQSSVHQPVLRYLKPTDRTSEDDAFFRVGDGEIERAPPGAEAGGRRVQPFAADGREGGTQAAIDRSEHRRRYVVEMDLAGRHPMDAERSQRPYR